MYAITVAVYATCVLAAMGVTWWSHHHPAHIAPVGRLLDAVFTSRAGRITVLVFWWWLGWHFLVVPIIGQ